MIHPTKMVFSTTVAVLGFLSGIFWGKIPTPTLSAPKLYEAHTQCIDDGLEYLEETVVPEDLKVYAGIDVAECDVLGGVYPVNALFFDHGGFVIHFNGNIRCTGDQGAYLVPSNVGVEIDEHGEFVSADWTLTGTIVSNTH